MKHALLSLLCAASLTAQAQTTAVDFNADDCDGNSHQLFSELEAGDVVILELVMMGCQPCVTAAQSLTANVLPNVSEPSRVKLYSIGFSNSVTCAQMNNWKSTNGFTHTVFAGMSNLTTYYGGMGMPTIVVVGGSGHTVYYSELGHSASDNPAILAAIEDALDAQVGIDEAGATEVAIGPNPTTDQLTLADKRWTRATISDTQGRIVLTTGVGAGTVDVAALPVGLYVLHVSNAAGAKGIARFEKR
jgi:hypothetical protein